MGVPMMYIGPVYVGMLHLFMDMEMFMPSSRVLFFMLVPVMFVMHVHVAVRRRFMGVQMFMHFPAEQENAGDHQ
jgi:hypothetical protein